MHVATWLLAATAATASALGLASCIKSTAFSCGGVDTTCGAGGRCEPEGFCSVSVATSECPSGRKFSDTAGDGLAGQCVGGSDPMSDGAIDPDGARSDGGRGCPGDYGALAAGGQPDHKYKRYAVPDDWSDQHNTRCVGDGAYLAIPDTAAELQAIYDLAGETTLWVGVTDGPGNGNEGTFKDVLGAGYDATAKVGAAITDNSPAKDCVATPDGTTLAADDCDRTFVAVCECDE